MEGEVQLSSTDSENEENLPWSDEEEFEAPEQNTFVAKRDLERLNVLKADDSALTTDESVAFVKFFRENVVFKKSANPKKKSTINRGDNYFIRETTLAELKTAIGVDLQITGDYEAIKNYKFMLTSMLLEIFIYDVLRYDHPMKFSLRKVLEFVHMDNKSNLPMAKEEAMPYTFLWCYLKFFINDGILNKNVGSIVYEADNLFNFLGLEEDPKYVEEIKNELRLNDFGRSRTYVSGNERVAKYFYIKAIVPFLIDMKCGVNMENVIKNVKNGTDENASDTQADSVQSTPKKKGKPKETIDLVSPNTAHGSPSQHTRSASKKNQETPNTAVKTQLVSPIGTVEVNVATGEVVSPPIESVPVPLLVNAAPNEAVDITNRLDDPVFLGLSQEQAVVYEKVSKMRDALYALNEKNGQKLVEKFLTDHHYERTLADFLEYTGDGATNPEYPYMLASLYILADDTERDTTFKMLYQRFIDLKEKNSEEIELINKNKFTVLGFKVPRYTKDIEDVMQQITTAEKIMLDAVITFTLGGTTDEEANKYNDGIANFMKMEDNIKKAEGWIEAQKEETKIEIEKAEKEQAKKNEKREKKKKADEEKKAEEAKKSGVAAVVTPPPVMAAVQSSPKKKTATKENREDAIVLIHDFSKLIDDYFNKKAPWFQVSDMFKKLQQNRRLIIKTFGISSSIHGQEKIDVNVTEDAFLSKIHILCLLMAPQKANGMVVDALTSNVAVVYKDMEYYEYMPFFDPEQRSRITHAVDMFKVEKRRFSWV